MVAACALLWSAWLGPSQIEKSQLLPSPVRLFGAVTDASGRPLSDVWICHTGPGLGPRYPKSDSLGRFDIETRAPAIVFRKGGFQSRYLRVSNKNQGSLAITLSGPTPQMKPCSASSRCVSLKYFGSAFCLPRIRGVNISKQGNDVDYGCRSYWVATQEGKIVAQHNAGPLWGPGSPLEEEVWSSTEYHETAYQDREGSLVTDARGESTAGKYWRVLGHSFESVSYRGVSAQQAAVLDPVIDGACIEPIPFGFDRLK